MNTSLEGKALITGASSGIGAVYAERLARRGHDLILVARSRERLETLATRIAGDTGRSVGVIVADLGAKADLARVEQMLRADAAITALVNNAGISLNADMADADPDRLEAIIRLNVLAPTRLAAAALQGFIARGRGTLINISSMAALAPEGLNAVYSGSKSYLLALSQRLHREVAGKGVRVQVVLPGATRTEIWEKVGVDIATVPPDTLMGVDDLVDAAMAGLDRGELVTIPSLPDIADWERYEAARRNLTPKLSLSSPAPRYGVRALSQVGGS